MFARTEQGARACSCRLAFMVTMWLRVAAVSRSVLV